MLQPFSGEEAGLAIGEVVLPQPLEARIEAEAGDPRPGLLEFLLPQRQGARVVEPEMEGLVDLQPRRFRRRACGRKSGARTIGPATRCGKYATKSAKSRKLVVGSISRRYTSMT